jgi:predicted DNA-binding ribbon-helix-helix protein
MRSEAFGATDAIDRVQTGVRVERRLLKVLKAVAELRDLALGDLLEEQVRDTFAGRRTFSDLALAQAAELMRIYGLDLDPVPGIGTEERI